METNASIPNTENTIIINEVQLILAGKRIHLAMYRTGIAILVLLTALVSFLIVTFHFYHFADIMFYLILPFILCSGLQEPGGYMD